MSIHRNRQESSCTKCHAARASVFGRWCDRCWAELTNEERALAAEDAQREGDDDLRLAPPRLARSGNGNGGMHILIDSADRRWYWEARGYVQTTVRTTPFGNFIYVKDDRAR